MVEGADSPRPRTPILELTMMQYFSQSPLTNAWDLQHNISSILSHFTSSLLHGLGCMGKGLMSLCNPGEDEDSGPM